MLKNKEYILFDLDGTLTDSGLGIVNSICHAFNKMGIKDYKKEDLYSAVGPPLDETFIKYGIRENEEIQRATEFYREYYSEKGIYENSVYEGVAELLNTLYERNKKLILATSKPTYFAEKVLAHFDLKRYFYFILGSNMDGTMTDKGEIIKFALKEAGVKHLEKAVMIGDRKYDILGARDAGISSIGVTYGFGQEAELQEAGADLLVETARAVMEILI